jgi:hypothetical protein
MSVEYHITGILQAALFVLSISAVYVQLRLVRVRRRAIAQMKTAEVATDNLSVIAVVGAFAAFFSFLIFSTATVPFAHYIFWSRIPACILAILLLWEFRRDHIDGVVPLLGPLAGGLFVSGLVSTALFPGVCRDFIHSLQVLVVSTGVVLVGGQIHQLWLLLKQRRIGALSLRARTLNVMKDVSTIAFGLTLGVHQSWSLVAVAGANAAMTALVIGVGMYISRDTPRASDSSE